MRVLTPAAAAIALLVMGGCSQRKTSSEAPARAPQEQHAKPGIPPETPTTGGEPREAPVAAAATVPEIWAQIAAEHDRLSAAIQEGRLQSVPRLAFGIRNLAVDLANKARASEPPPSPKLTAEVDQLRTAVDELAERSVAGDLKAAQTELARLSAILEAIKASVGPQL